MLLLLHSQRKMQFCARKSNIIFLLKFARGFEVRLEVNRNSLAYSVPFQNKNCWVFIFICLFFISKFMTYKLCEICVLKIIWKNICLQCPKRYYCFIITFWAERTQPSTWKHQTDCRLFKNRLNFVRVGTSVLTYFDMKFESRWRHQYLHGPSATVTNTHSIFNLKLKKKSQNHKEN